ncbi:hypothetical protein GOBAR_AA09148 [Gossypium barbadense]|uniref:Uncharacterized protein n=1 Tax=Gossypium barbadense TaxID=3634 RepID=A0A2P5Y7B0_GOSBA|nr:hypothetical protein GOBAR_AA09148 [Gossypium barbadense]
MTGPVRNKTISSTRNKVLKQKEWSVRLNSLRNETKSAHERNFGGELYMKEGGAKDDARGGFRDTMKGRGELHLKEEGAEDDDEGCKGKGRGKEER